MQLVILVGLQGAGKSSFYRSRFAATHVHISKDNFPNAAHRERRQQRLIAEALAAGQSAVVDNTNITPAMRATPIAQAQEFGARVIGYYFDAPLGECLERNRHREGKARVPDVALYVTAHKLVAPHRDEGFDELYRVTLPAPGVFVLEEWAGES